MADVVTGIQALRDAGVFAYVVPFLLAIAVVYGLLDHLNMPKDKSIRSLIAILFGFMVLPLGGALQPFLTSLVLGGMVIVATVLILLIMAETTGIKGGGGKHIWETHPQWTGIIFIMIAGLIFVAAGGLDLLGLPGVRLGGGLTLLFFLIIVALGVWWVAGAGEKKD